MRRYPLTLLATVKGKGDNDAFSLLFSYISGNNSKREKVPMTTPVVSKDPSSEPIPMTAPVISEPGSFSFVLPSGYSIETVPEPADPRVEIGVQPPRLLAVLRFRGRTNPRTVAEKYAELRGVVGSIGLIPRGDPFLMRYNPPFVPGLFRRNEVAVEVVEAAPA